MAHDWYKFYPKNINHEINISNQKSIAQVIESTCKKFHGKTSLICMGATLSYEQFDKLANYFASFLQNHLGLKKGDRIAIMLPNVIQFPIVFYAAQKIGLVCVNTNPLYTPREMKHQFKDSGAKALVIIDLFMDKLEEIIKETDIEHVVTTGIGDQLPFLKGSLIKVVMKLKKMIPTHNLRTTSFRDAIKIGQKKPHHSPSFQHDDIAILQYTGGTTGVSKGAMLTQKNILANMSQIEAWSHDLLKEGEEVVLTALPLYHIFALSVNFLAFLKMGAQLILVPKPIPIENTVKLFKKYHISVMTGVNTLYNALNHNQEFKALAPRCLKIALAGGMALQDSVNKEFQNITGIKITEGFGLTEASPVTHCNPLTRNNPTGSMGVPLPSTDAKIIDEAAKEVAVGEVGELIITGPQVMKGYWQKPDETAKVLKNGWLWTGDMAKRDSDGYFYIVDRKKDMILVSGFNVYPNEVEEVLVAHPKVLEAAVVGVPDNSSGEAVKAFVVPKDPSLTKDELKSYCQQNLTGYKRPRYFEFKTELPKTNVGKILRRELRDST